MGERAGEAWPMAMKLVSEATGCEPEVARLSPPPRLRAQCTLIDVVAREDFEEDESGGGADTQRCANDVFLVEGEQVAHLSREAWRRR
jgi:hypothetical protein